MKRPTTTSPVKYEFLIGEASDEIRLKVSMAMANQ